MTDEVFRYSGRIYVRPIGRGISFADADGPNNAPQLEEVLDDGFYHADIVISRDIYS